VGELRAFVDQAVAIPEAGVEARVRLVRPSDAESLAGLLAANRGFLRPWTPVRPDTFFTPDGQGALIAEALDAHRDGAGFPCVITDRDDHPIGQIMLTEIHRGPIQSGSVGYWVSGELNGLGIARTALAMIVGEAFGTLDLHRLTAATLLANHASQRVLESAGFTRIGVAQEAYRIDDRWQDHLLYQLVRPG
jgi:ribosomal-protein-alanine N-acetyltransferase